MHNTDIIILAIAAGAAWFVVNRTRAQAAPVTVQRPQGITSDSLAWYLNDIYSRLNDGEYRDQTYLTDLYGRSYS